MNAQYRDFFAALDGARGIDAINGDTRIETWLFNSYAFGNESVPYSRTSDYEREQSRRDRIVIEARTESRRLLCRK